MNNKEIIRTIHKIQDKLILLHKQERIQTEIFSDVYEDLEIFLERVNKIEYERQMYILNNGN